LAVAVSFFTSARDGDEAAWAIAPCAAKAAITATVSELRVFFMVRFSWGLIGMRLHRCLGWDWTARLLRLHTSSALRLSRRNMITRQESGR